jgi:hypothetical protein
MSFEAEEPTFQSDDPIGEIDDRSARTMARTIVHVRRFFPFYAGGIAFAVAMLVLPVVGGGGGTTASLAGSSTSAAGAVNGSGTKAAAANGARTATGPLAAAANFLGGTSDLVSSIFDDGGSGSEEVAADAPAGGVGAAVDGRRAGASPAPVGTPSGPDTPSTDFGDDGSSDDSGSCSIAAPSPAPTVTPSHEISGAQDTVEAAARMELPADVASTTSPVTNDAICSVPDAPVEAPSVPLPATPVGGPTAGNPALSMVLSLLFG